MRYENLTDEELLRVADGQVGLIKALAERLEMRLRDIKEIDNPTQVEDDHPTQVEDDHQLKLF